MPLAFIFPGQGSQYAGMGRDVFENHPAAAAVFRAADEALGFSLSRLCFDGPEEQLKLTANTQPAILTVSTALARVLADHGIRPDYVAGHSLGEYSGLVAAGALEFRDAVRIVRKRGEFMQQAVPEGEGAMAAIVGMNAEQVRQLCADAAQSEVCSPANFNSPEQTVIAGSRTAVERAITLATEREARAVPLPVSAPFHCELMRPAQQKLEPILRQTAFGNPACPLISNIETMVVTDGETARDCLVRQVTAPVQWDGSMRALASRGVEMFVEVGPGRVLCGLLRRIDRSRKCIGVENVASLESAFSTLSSDQR
jgi:[acyl-carrier-protein] S-malonyltransferase